MAKYGTYEYGKEWRDTHKARLAAERKVKYQARKQRTQRRYALLNQYKMAKGCALCGYNQAAVALDFDHIDRETKKFSISHRLDLSTARTLMREVRKCQILCANCHRIKTLEEGQFARIS